MHDTLLEISTDRAKRMKQPTAIEATLQSSTDINHTANQLSTQATNLAHVYTIITTSVAGYAVKLRKCRNMTFKFMIYTKKLILVIEAFKY